MLFIWSQWRVSPVNCRQETITPGMGRLIAPTAVILSRAFFYFAKGVFIDLKRFYIRGWCTLAHFWFRRAAWIPRLTLHRVELRGDTKGTPWIPSGHWTTFVLCEWFCDFLKLLPPLLRHPLHIKKICFPCLSFQMCSICWFKISLCWIQWNNESSIHWFQIKHYKHRRKLINKVLVKFHGNDFNKRLTESFV